MRCLLSGSKTTLLFFIRGENMSLLQGVEVYLKPKSHTRMESLSDTVPIHHIDVPGRQLREFQS